MKNKKQYFSLKKKIKIFFQLGEPQYLGERFCEHRFVWETTLACNTKQSCRTTDPITGFVYVKYIFSIEFHQRQRCIARSDV